MLTPLQSLLWAMRRAGLNPTEPEMMVNFKSNFILLKQLDYMCFAWDFISSFEGYDQPHWWAQHWDSRLSSFLQPCEEKVMWPGEI